MPITEANETKSLTLQEIVSNLNIKQQSFCEFYLKGDEAHVAYRKAGYKTKNSINATTLAHRLMSTNVYVRAFITRHREIKHEEFTFDRHQFALYLKDAIDGKWEEEQVVVVGRGTEARVMKRKISPRDRIRAMEIAERVFKIVDDTPTLQGTTVDDKIATALSQRKLKEDADDANE